MNKTVKELFKKNKLININLYSCITVKYCKPFEDVVLRLVKVKIKLYSFSFQIQKIESFLLQKKTIGSSILKTPTRSTYDTTFGCEFLLRTLIG
jgi:hypothetical protein